MNRAADVSDFLASPLQRHVVLGSFICFTATADLRGLVVRGRPDEAEVRQLLAFVDTWARSAPEAHASLIDARRLEGIDERAFAVLVDHLSTRDPIHRRRITRQAFLRSGSVAGALVAGFHHLVASPFPVRIHQDPREALEWLDHDPAFAAELDAIGAGEAASEGVTPRLRRVLVHPLHAVTLASAAAALGMSARSLQRHLQAEGTTFQDEYNAAQVRAAQALMRASEIKLTALAFEVGCSSPAHFSALFRRVTGESPSEWRARLRPAFTRSAA